MNAKAQPEARAPQRIVGTAVLHCAFGNILNETRAKWIIISTTYAYILFNKMKMMIPMHTHIDQHSV